MGRSVLATAGQMIAAVAVAVAVSVIALIAISRVQWPAFPSSNQLHALTTVGQVGCLVLLLGTGFVWRRGHQWLARIAAAVFLSAFTVVTLGMPLGASRLYLFGISVDQQFRTEYLTRLAESPALHDMTYTGLPPFYPAGWFWLGGRAAALTGTPAWEMFKPWAIVSIAIAVVLAMALWSALIRFEYALIVTVATTAVTLAYSSPEPYAAIITVLIPPVLVLAWSGLRGKTRQGGWAAVAGVGLFLGVSATFYTLLFGYAAFTVGVMGIVVAIARRSIEPLLRLVVAAVITAAIGAITWLPFLLQAIRHPMSGTGSAQHYLPADGAVLTFPMLQFSLLGALCMLGTLWLVWRARTSTRAAALGIGVLTVYAWSALSMLTTLLGTTLLSFRLQPTLTVLLSAAGVFGFIEVTLALATRTNRKVIGVGAAIGLIGAIGFSQDIPDVLRPDLTVAYTDTDGYGQRGDRRPPGAEKYYSELDVAIRKATGQPRENTVVLTADYSFLSYYPYYGFQGLTSHYANPLAEFDKRAAAIESWADLKNADQLVHALDSLPWPPPTVFLMRRGANDTYSLRLAEDVYPNQPNVRRYTVDFDGKLFSGPHFTVKTIGPFVLAIRNP
ncbi:Arabinofuranosyltransferase AftA [uncultured Mycobacterium sp.]|uniref:Galactan 5-O-arabinofuranosyltransferase n=1 Tax=uncultured Mycobacterium sp. TaxID=171292 RepID=A0A1Y5P9F0_9MYCO|nr:Arabinofuranosyltransferase AftA [uncultured Mycobacterium sp.]